MEWVGCVVCIQEVWGEPTSCFPELYHRDPYIRVESALVLRYYWLWFPNQK